MSSEKRQQHERANRYEESLEAHRRIEALYSLVAERKAYFRNLHSVSRHIPLPPGQEPFVDTDRVYCALANKAATTKRSIALLCGSGDGQGALALMRVLLENALLIEWLTRGPRLDRLETYVLFTSVKREQGVAALEHFYKKFCDQGTALASDPYHSAIAEHVFQGNTDTWAYFPSQTRPGRLRRVSVRGMFEEVTDTARPMEYEIWYALGSDEVHSSPMSLSHILGELRARDTFILDAMPSPDACLIALAISNVSMVLVLDALNEFVGLGLEDDLSALKTWMRREDQLPPNAPSGPLQGTHPVVGPRDDRVDSGAPQSGVSGRSVSVSVSGGSQTERESRNC